MKQILTAFGLLLFAFQISAQTGVEFAIRKGVSGANYEVYMRSNVSWPFPQNITATGQVTIKVPSAANFVVVGLVSNTSFPGTGIWSDNSRVNGPAEAPAFDYISFGYIGSRQYPFVPGMEVLLFTFNVPDPCLATLEIIDNYTEPFMPPNSQNANIGNSLVSLGSQAVNNGTGVANAWYGNYIPDAACGGPLPLDLVSFTGKIENCKAHLTWKTENEINVNYFVIEKSTNGFEWRPIDIVEAVGNSSDQQVYNYQDREEGYQVYYRLKIVDLDESFEYSNIIVLESDCYEGNEIVGVFPNPVRNTVNLNFVSLGDGDLKILIIDVLGRELMQLEFGVIEGFNKFSFETRGLAAGEYFLQPTINNERKDAVKFIKIN